MNNSNKRDNQRLPSWQLKKMKSIIEEKWSEIWQVAISRHQKPK
jgi:hypothetical protein